MGTWLACLLGAAIAAPVAAQPLPFTDPAWKFEGDTRVAELHGQSALQMRIGQAVRRDVQFEDGTLEFELAPTSYRSFVGVFFRAQADGEHEYIYFRLHKSRLPDALQYEPVWAGQGSWQLYHSAGYAAMTTFAPERWLKVRLVVKGNQAALYLGGEPAPAMVIPELKREARSGFIGFRSFAGPEDAPPGALVGNIANVVVRPGVVPADFPAVAADAVAPAGSLLRFRLSPAYTVAAEGPILSLEGAPGATANWQTVSAERSGLLNLGRFVTRAPRSRGTALARVTLHAQQAGSKPLELGYSDDISVFLNGQLLFTGHASYSFNFPRREGLIGLGQETLYLPLRAGDNELTLAVSEVFGGWGLMARLPDPGGVEVRLP